MTDQQKIALKNAGMRNRLVTLEKVSKNIPCR